MQFLLTALLLQGKRSVEPLKVSGVGPKLALSLSTLAPACHCFTGNLKALTRVPGIGKRTGERLIVELEGQDRKAVSSL